MNAEKQELRGGWDKKLIREERIKLVMAEALRFRVASRRGREGALHAWQATAGCREGGLRKAGGIKVEEQREGTSVCERGREGRRRTWRERREGA